MTRHYQRAPITEAIIAINFAASAASKEEVASIQLSRREEYPSRDELFTSRAQIEITGAGASSAIGTPRFFGYSFKSRDEKHVFQARPDGFSLSRLAPYESWEPFRSEARAIWTEFRDRIKPSSIDRVAVRYLNRIDIPVTGPIDLQDYLLVAPELPDDIPRGDGGISQFFMQLTIPQPAVNAVAIVSEAAVRPARQDCASILLDIDVYRDQRVPQDEQSLWDYFEELHALKNDIFEKSITNKVRELIE